MKLLIVILLIICFAAICYFYGEQSHKIQRPMLKLFPFGTDIEATLSILKENGFTYSLESFDDTAASIPSEHRAQLGARIELSNGATETITNISLIKCEMHTGETNITAEIWLHNNRVQEHTSTFSIKRGNGFHSH